MHLTVPGVLCLLVSTNARSGRLISEQPIKCAIISSHYDARNYMKTSRLLIMLSSALTIGIVTAGCESKTRRFAQQNEILQQSEALFQCYLQGDVKRARVCLYDSAKMLEESLVLESIGRSQLLSKTYFRLYVLEKRANNEIAAEANLIKARYWSLKNGELMGVDPAKTVEQITNYSPERIFQYVDEFDKKNNKGKQPAYLEGIQKGKGG
jgi:hypothetical protein